MSNVHDIFGGRNKEDDANSDDDENNRYVGGIGDRGGGSGLAVQPNPGAEGGSGSSDAIFNLAESASSADSSGAAAGPRRTITMYRSGFVVDNGPYRRLDDPANSEFLRSLATGKTPRELIEDASSSSNGDVTVALVDKRSEEYVEKFQSFSGAGTSLGSATPSAAAAEGESSDAITTAALPMAPPAVDETRPVTSIAIRLLNGKRKIIKINLDQSVSDLAAHLREDAVAASADSFRLVSGFPPKPLVDFTQSVEAAGLKGAQVSMQKV